MQDEMRYVDARSGDVGHASRSRHASAHAPALLKPILSEAVSSFIETSPGRLIDLADKYGSPLNIVWPQMLKQNVQAFRKVLQAHQVRHAIYYGAKVNKSQALVRAAVEAGIGVDVSSIHEMRDALRAGAKMSDLCATGPAKTSEFHAELLAGAALISVDSTEELTDLIESAATIAPPSRPRLLLRYRPAASETSRFGMGREDILSCLDLLSRKKDRFSFEGFHFHLSGYAADTRAQAMRELAPLIDAARGLDLRPRIIDIGGGMPVRYVDGDDYATFLQYQCKEHYRNGKVPESFYPYGSRLDAAAWLEGLLASPYTENETVAAWLTANDLILALEPGRSLVDQAAISVFRITRVKQLACGRHAIFVEGSSFSACETWFVSEFLVDPILISAAGGDDAAQAARVQAYIAGHSCLDDDVLTNRLLAFDRKPRAGDLLVYANTAGYQMDLLENEFHRHPMPRRIAVTVDAAGRQHISPDD